MHFKIGELDAEAMSPGHPQADVSYTIADTADCVNPPLV
jgi:hypothetical protein